MVIFGGGGGAGGPSISMIGDIRWFFFFLSMAFEGVLVVMIRKESWIRDGRTWYVVANAAPRPNKLRSWQ